MLHWIVSDTGTIAQSYYWSQIPPLWTHTITITMEAGRQSPRRSRLWSINDMQCRLPSRLQIIKNCNQLGDVSTADRSRQNESWFLYCTAPNPPPKSIVLTMELFCDSVRVFGIVFQTKRIIPLVHLLIDCSFDGLARNTWCLAVRGMPNCKLAKVYLTYGQR